MEKERQDYIIGQRIWIKAQKNLAAQLSSAISYNRLEIEYHQQAIDNDTAMLKHYVQGIEEAQANLERYIKENEQQ